jgi:hypothetical protein
MKVFYVTQLLRKESLRSKPKPKSIAFSLALAMLTAMLCSKAVQAMTPIWDVTISAQSNLF